MKKALISVIPALLLASCSFLNQPVGEYFSYWGSEAFVTTSIVNVPNQNDIEGIISIASDKNAEVILNVANPKNFNLVMPSVGNTEMIQFNDFDPQPVFGVDYMIEKLSSKELKLTYTAQFLKKHEWGQKDLGATLTLVADDSRKFKKPYTFKIKSNTKPPQPSVILAQTNESTPHYVLCLTVPDMDAQVNGKKLHKDIAEIVINESSYELKINDSGLDFVKPMYESFITRTEVIQLTTHGAEAVPTGNWTLFYKTDRQVGSAYKEYTVTLKDQKGLSSEKLETGTTINKPAEETVMLNAGTQESGSGTNALPFIIQAAGTKPEAQLIISCTSSGTTVHCTVTDVNTGISNEYNGNPANVPLSLNGKNEKLYEVKYNTKGDGYNPTTLKTKYYKILKLHTVTFNANGGKFADDSTAKTETVLHGRTVTAPSASPTRVGNVFVGWYKEEDGTNEWNFTDDTIRSNTIIYAKWSDKAVEIKSDEDGAWKKLKEEAAKTNGVSVIVIDGEIKATTDSGNSGEITIGRNLTIQGKTGAATDKLDANGQNHRIFKVTSGKTLTLQNLTLKGGKPDASNENGNGGGILLQGGALNMKNCDVKGNEAANAGGGIYAERVGGTTASSVTISGGTIGGTDAADKNKTNYGSGGGIHIDIGCSLTMKDNAKVTGNESATSGGGIHAENDSTLVIEHCSVTANTASGSGGGIHARGALTVDSCAISDNKTTGDSGGGVCVSGTAEIKGSTTIAHNKADVSGGGIYMASGSVTLINATIGGEQDYEGTDLAKTKGNKAKDGGGIYVASGTLSIKDSTLSFNKSTSGGNGGGGISASNGTLNIKGCTFTHNDSGNGTGGGINADNSTLTMTGCTLTDNNAGGGGGGILTSGTSSLTMETCTLTDNAANFNGGGGVYASGSAFTMTDCTLTDNVANNNGGGGVYVAEGTFTMKGSSRITPSSGPDENAMGKNEVFLKNGKMITVPAALTGTLPVARITPDTYNTTTQVLTGGAVGTEHGKFTVTPKDLGSGNTQQWEINSTGFLQKTPVVIDSSGDAWKKLKDAVAAANDDDVIIIDGAIKATNGSGGKIEIKKNLTIRGKNGADSDILNANRGALNTNAHSIFDMDRGKTLKLENLTLKGGKGIAGGTLGGGAILIPSGGGTTAELSDCIIEDCQAEKGGAIGCGKGGTVKLTNTTIKKCKASGSGSDSGGGAIFAQGATVEMTDCTLTGNEAKSGGAIYAQKAGAPSNTPSTVTISGGTIGGTEEADANKATGNGTGSDGGGGIYVGETCTLTMQNNAQVIGNTALFNGAGIYTKGTLTTENCTITDNKTIGANNNTGGGTTAELSDCVIEDCTADKGGAIGCGKGGTVKLTNTTIKKCTAHTSGNTGSGGAIYAEGATVTMTNCTFTGNKADKQGGAICAQKYMSSPYTPSNVTISGGTIGGTEVADANKTTVAHTDGGGGGIYIGEDCTLTMKAPAGSPAQGVQVIGNKATFNGAGIYTKGNLTMENCTLSSNTARNGGGIRADNGNHTVKDCTLTNNEAYLYGGGIYVKGGSLTLNNTTIGGEQFYDGTDLGKTKGNKAKSGGGVYIKGNGTLVTMNGGSIQYNKTTDGDGGGVYIKGDGTSFTMNGGKITQCKADVTSPSSSAGRGGGIYIYGDDASSPINITIKGTAEISHNESTCQGTRSGGGIYGGTNGIITVSENATIKNNSAKGFGGGVYFQNTFIFMGGTITENTASIGAGIFSENSSTKLEMSGNARVTNDNDIYLPGGRVVTITGGALTGTAPVARITPETYNTSTQVLTAGSGVTLANETYKFAVTPQIVSGTPQPWTVGGNGYLKQGRYTEVPYNQLGTYLANASETEVNYIEVTGISAGDLKGTAGSSSNPANPGPLGQKIKSIYPKKVALKLPDGLSVTDMSYCFASCKNLISVENIPSGVTDMQACFYGCKNLTTVPAIPATVRGMMECFRFCTSLTTAPNIPSGVNSMAYCFNGCTSLTTVSNIPSGVTNMEGCFQSCTSLTTVPDIPSSVTDMRYCFRNCTVLKRVKINRGYADYNFYNTFEYCTALKDGGIKVPSTEFETYKANATSMGTTADKFAALP